MPRNAVLPATLEIFDPVVAHVDTDALHPLKVMVPGNRRVLDPDGPTVSVVVPAMNEARNLPWLAERMPENVHEILLVDGRSTDDTVQVARRLWPDVRVIGQSRRGKGNALACGFAAVTGDITVMIDADGSMDPGEIPYFVDALLLGADYAKGSRFTSGGGSSDITRTRALGNRFLNGFMNLRYGAGYTDLCYGYNAFWSRVQHSFGLDPGSSSDDPQAKLWGDGFEIETLLNIRVFVAGYQVREVASFESDRLHGVSNLNAVTDGLRVLRTILAERRRARTVRATARRELEFGRARHAARRPFDLGPDTEPMRVTDVSVGDRTPETTIDLTTPSRHPRIVDQRVGDDPVRG
jgi:glycosyltransferase involved in cell wall biosynthesis